mmetsp:Transcript_51596/g.77164  ORF Transcript_51596/g.77164 Transcript_51596/m.77164 type:complete len:214 (+) Transcript_51596:1694-2335(+)
MVLCRSMTRLRRRQTSPSIRMDMVPGYVDTVFHCLLFIKTRLVFGTIPASHRQATALLNSISELARGITSHNLHQHITLAQVHQCTINRGICMDLLTSILLHITNINPTRMDHTKVRPHLLIRQGSSRLLDLMGHIHTILRVAGGHHLEVLHLLTREWCSIHRANRHHLMVESHPLIIHPPTITHSMEVVGHRHTRRTQGLILHLMVCHISLQ